MADECQSDVGESRSHARLGFSLLIGPGRVKSQFKSYFTIRLQRDSRRGNLGRMAKTKAIPGSATGVITSQAAADNDVKNSPDFLTEARTAVQRVRRALSAAFASVGADPTQGRALARQLGLDKSLAWRVSRIVVEDDPFVAIPLLPGRVAQRSMLQSLQRAEVPPQVIEEVRQSVGDFESMVETHAGDRETFGMMLSELTDKGRSERDEDHRKLAFLGHSAMWGVQARVRIVTHVIAPGDAPNFLEAILVSGLLDFRRLRSNHPWTVASYGALDNEGCPVTTGRIIPLDPRVSERGGPPLLLDYCSASLPQMQETPGPDGSTSLQAEVGPVGNSGLFSCLTGLWMQGLVPRWWEEPNEQDAEFGVLLKTPSEALLLDLFVHQSLAPALNPVVISYGAMAGDPLGVSDGYKRRMLPLADKIIDLGANPPDLTTLEMPAYPQMMEWVFRRIGHDAAEFRGFRFRRRYPLIPTKVAYFYPPLPETP